MRVSTYSRQFHADCDSSNADLPVSVLCKTLCGGALHNVLCDCSARMLMHQWSPVKGHSSCVRSAVAYMGQAKDC